MLRVLNVLMLEGMVEERVFEFGVFSVGSFFLLEFVDGALVLASGNSVIVEAFGLGLRGKEQDFIKKILLFFI